LRENYLEQFGKFCEQLQRECGALGVDYQRVLTSQPFHESLGAFLDARMRDAKR